MIVNEFMLFCIRRIYAFNIISFNLIQYIKIYVYVYTEHRTYIMFLSS